MVLVVCHGPGTAVGFEYLDVCQGPACSVVGFDHNIYFRRVRQENRHVVRLRGHHHMCLARVYLPTVYVSR